MATRTANRGYTRAELRDGPASILAAVSGPLDEIDADVQGIADDLAAEAVARAAADAAEAVDRAAGDAAVLAAAVLPGEIRLWSLLSVPSGWALCDGSPLVTASALRTALIAASNPHGFSGANPRVPDLRGRAPIGAGTGNGLTARTLGAPFGNETVTLNELDMPARIAYSGDSPFRETSTLVGVAGAGLYAPVSASQWGKGGGRAHVNMQPSLPVNFIIKL